MEIKPRRTEEDYAATLAVIEALMDAEPGTRQGRRLDMRVRPVKVYEGKHPPRGRTIPSRRFAPDGEPGYEKKKISSRSSVREPGDSSPAFSYEKEDADSGGNQNHQANRADNRRLLGFPVLKR